MWVGLKGTWSETLFSSIVANVIGIILTVDTRQVELELYRLILVDSGSACTTELTGGLLEKIQYPCSDRN